MRRAGRVVANTQGVLVLRSEQSEPPEIGAPIFDDQLEELGTVVDVFGPVERPFLAVSPAEGISAAETLSEIVYLR